MRTPASRNGSAARLAGLVGVWVSRAADGPRPEDIPRRLPEFVFGSAATDINADAMAAAAAIGYRWVRAPIRWAMLEPTVASRPTLTRARSPRPTSRPT